ncbi:IclR family transcriptional regulator [Cupriavidus gilardii]|uniref:IclR family transcriptional regulator n=1 Tax=Cupriavidus gilardii TaxID=82541 RepID=UPI0021C0829C|nr:IclR family transcriptional regulator [Cupriavidus gilardii]MCT9124791.1 IclR family transcriptional regulator [Cupriavidus gilardii]
MTRSDSRSNSRSDSRADSRSGSHPGSRPGSRASTAQSRPRSSEPADKDRQFATTLANGVDILLAFDSGDAMLGNRDFAERTGLSKTTVARLTHTLTALGYLRHDTVLRKYRLGAAVLSMGYPLLASMHLRQLARPMMKALADRLCGAVSLGIRDRTQMIYVETARSTDSLIVTPEIGAALPMLTTAIGRAWLCRAPANERDAVLNRLRLQDPKAFAYAQPRLADARRDLERQGYCSNRAEWRPEVYGFAVPMCQPVGSQLFVLNCGVPVGQGSFAAIEKQAGPQLRALMLDIERMLGLR